MPAILPFAWCAGPGPGFSLLLLFNVLPRLSLIALYVLYLSLLYGGQTFMSFQWDTFLLETGFLSLLLSFAQIPGIWLLRWLLFRFMFMSGVVKLLSGDPNWWNLSALSYHFFTQPLPTPLAWYAAHLPPSVLRFATGGVFLVELLLPFLIFCPRRLRFVAAFGILLLQSCILITGNYNWFNLQTMLLCLLLFDDAALRKCLPQRLLPVLSRRVRASPSKAVSMVIGACSVVLVFLSLVQMDMRFGGSPPPAVRELDQLFEPLHMVSSYGLFAVMTTERNEIIIEGSDDGVEWREYEFRYKPGDVSRRPPWNIPHQPRLDWQMWFAALDDPRRVSLVSTLPARDCWKTSPALRRCWMEIPSQTSRRSIFVRSFTTTPFPAPMISAGACGGSVDRWGCTFRWCVSRRNDGNHYTAWPVTARSSAIRSQRPRSAAAS